MSILAPANFKNGRYRIPQNPVQQVDLQLYIDRVENYYLPRMFGKALYDLFIADLALPVVGEPTDPRFVFIYNPFTTQENECDFNQSLGIIEMLQGLVYYEYGRDNITRLTTDGIKLTDGANSTNITGIHHDLNGRYNDSIATFKAIQYYMDVTNDVDYPEYEGLHLRYNHVF